MLIIVLIAIVTPLIFFFVVISPWIILWFGLAVLPNPPKPEIAYGEFPFQLIYELDEKIITIDDVAICEFDGYGQRTEAGQCRKWKTHLKSGADALISENERGEETDIVWITLLDLRNDGIYDAYGNEVLELYFFGGNGHYYMNDELGSRDRKVQDFTMIDYMYKRSDGTIGHSAFKAEEAYEKFNIRLIRWENSPPIENKF